MQESLTRKKLVIDTSVLLYDKECIVNLCGNDIIIPLVVLEEIDKFKTREGILGENARAINRFLDEIREIGSLHEGVYLADIDINVKVELNSSFKGIETLDRNCNDNVIIATANLIKEKNEDKDSEIVIITKDINLRVKSDAIGISANDYYADYKFIESDNIYTGFEEIDVEPEIINKAYQNKLLMLSGNQINGIELYENQCVVLKSESQSALMFKKDHNLILLPTKPELLKKSGIDPKNKEQITALHFLLNCDIPLITLTGVPGSGKTFLTLMSSLKMIEREEKNRIIFTRPIQTVGKDIGFLPGTLNEKMAPWLAPIVDNFRNQFGDLAYFDLLMEKGTIDIAPLSYIRGRSFNDAIIIVDEAQNATVHELKTVITRTGKNSKIILLGDIEQVDLAYVNKFSNGLTIVIEKLKNESLTAHVNFSKGYRSDLANVAAKLL